MLGRWTNNHACIHLTQKWPEKAQRSRKCWCTNCQIPFPQHSHTVIYTGTCLFTKMASPSVPQTRHCPSTSRLLTDRVWLGSMWVVSRRPLLESPLSQALRDWPPPAGATALRESTLLFLPPGGPNNTSGQTVWSYVTQRTQCVGGEGGLNACTKGIEIQKVVEGNIKVANVSNWATPC